MGAGAAEKGFLFLKDVPDHDLRTWSTFPDTPLYAFMKTYFEDRIKIMAHTALNDRKFTENPVLLAEMQGRAAGIRAVIEVFFNAVRTEHQRRLDRKIASESDSGA